MAQEHRPFRRISFLLAFLATTVLVLPARAEPAEAPSAGLAELESALAQGRRTMTVERAVELALQSAPSIDRARASVAVARAGVRTTWSAFVPRLDLSARYMRIGGFEDGAISLGSNDIPTDQAQSLADSVEDPAARMLLSAMIDQQSNLGEVSFETPRNQTAFRATLAVPISDMALTVLPAYRAAEARVELEERRAEAEQQEVAFAAEEAYYRYAQARGAFVVAEQAQTLAEEHRDQVAAMVEADLAAEADRLAAEARVAAAATAVERARGGVTMARTGLLTLLHIENDGSELALDVPLARPPASPPAVTDDLVLRAWAQRPEVQAVEALVEVHEQSGRAARGGTSPRLMLVAGAEYSNPNQRVIPPEDEFIPSWEVGAMLTWSPNDSATAVFRSREARARRDTAEAELDRLRDAVRLQLTRARQDQVSALAVMAASEERIEAARAAWAARRAELEAGEAVTAELLDAELELTRARLELLSASVDLRVAEARFRRALGR